MSKFSKLGLRRAAGAVAVAAAAVVGITSMGTGAASAQKLANGYKVVTTPDGESVQMWRTDEFGSSVGTVANNPLSRGLRLSGTYTAKASPGVGGTLHLGYIVGCQVNVAGITSTLGAGFSLQTFTLTGGASISLPITPGQVAYLDDAVTDVDLSDKGFAAIQVSNIQITLPSCGGYASARSFAQVLAAKGYSAKGGTLNVDGSVMQASLYGQPFSVS